MIRLILLLKSFIPGYRRRLASGKEVWVQAHTDKRARHLEDDQAQGRLLFAPDEPEPPPKPERVLDPKVQWAEPDEQPARAPDEGFFDTSDPDGFWAWADDSKLDAADAATVPGYRRFAFAVRTAVEKQWTYRSETDEKKLAAWRMVAYQTFLDSTKTRAVSGGDGQRYPMVAIPGVSDMKCGQSKDDQAATLVGIVYRNSQSLPTFNREDMVRGLCNRMGHYGLLGRTAYRWEPVVGTMMAHVQNVRHGADCPLSSMDFMDPDLYMSQNPRLVNGDAREYLIHMIAPAGGRTRTADSVLFPVMGNSQTDKFIPFSGPCLRTAVAAYLDGADDDEIHHAYLTALVGNYAVSNARSSLDNSSTTPESMNYYREKLEDMAAAVAAVAKQDRTCREIVSSGGSYEDNSPAKLRALAGKLKRAADKRCKDRAVALVKAAGIKMDAAAAGLLVDTIVDQAKEMSYGDPDKLAETLHPIARKIHRAKPDERASVERHIRDTINPKHFSNVEITDVLSVECKHPAWDSLSQSKDNVTQFFHGTRKASLGKILLDRMRSPMERGGSGVSNGSMYGPGVYFADQSSKAYQYSEDDGWMVLASVVRGKEMVAQHHGDHISHLASTGYDSVRAATHDEGGDVMNPEFIVPSGDYVNIRYLVKIKKVY